MKVLLDTSVLVPALVPAHDHHARCLPWLSRSASGDVRAFVASHSLMELYAVLTALPLRPRISPNVAARLIDESVVRHSRLVGLEPTEVAELVDDAAGWGLTGGVVHDALIARVARKARVDLLVTLNVSDFRRAWPDGHDRIAAP